jgi:hypothetical protein
MNTQAYRSENLRAFLDMDVDRTWIEHDLTRMLKTACRHVDFEGNVITGKRLRDEIESFLINNWETQRVQLREV